MFSTMMSVIQTVGSLAIIYAAISFHREQKRVSGLWVELDVLHAEPTGRGTYDCTVRLSNTGSADLTMLYCAAKGIEAPENGVLTGLRRSLPMSSSVTFELKGCDRDACLWFAYLSRSDVHHQYFRTFALFPEEGGPHLQAQAKSIMLARMRDRKNSHWQTGDVLSPFNGENRVWVSTSRDVSAKAEILENGGFCCFRGLEDGCWQVDGWS